jgi:hypothetical protein
MGERVPVEVRGVIDPAGWAGVLLQLPDGYVIMKPRDATVVATMILDTVTELLAAT